MSDAPNIPDGYVEATWIGTLVGFTDPINGRRLVGPGDKVIVPMHEAAASDNYDFELPSEPEVEKLDDLPVAKLEKLITDLGLPLPTEGSGQNGRVLKDDLINFYERAINPEAEDGPDDPDDNEDSTGGDA